MFYTLGQRDFFDNVLELYLAFMTFNFFSDTAEAQDR